MTSRITEDILDYWFGSLQEGFSSDAKRKLWYAFDPKIDADIRHRFIGLLEQADHGELANWQKTPRSCLAFILLTDQFTRNIYRGSRQAFASDHLALDAARVGVRAGLDRELAFDERAFFYMPFEHSEDLLDQHISVGLFTQLRDETRQGFKHLTGNALRYSQQHRDVIQRFGRFPHRNELLGRKSTPEEVIYLKDATHYGQ